MSETFTFLDIYLWTHTSYGKSPPARFLSKSKVRFFLSDSSTRSGADLSCGWRFVSATEKLFQRVLPRGAPLLTVGQRWRLRPLCSVRWQTEVGVHSPPLTAARHHKSPARAMCNRFSLSSAVNPTTVVTVAVKNILLCCILHEEVSHHFSKRGFSSPPKATIIAKKKRKEAHSAAPDLCILMFIR